MKLVSVLLASLVGFTAHADYLAEFKCISATYTGTVVTVKGCFQGSNTSGLDRAKIAGCKKGAPAVVGIQAKTKDGKVKQQFLKANEVELGGVESFQVYTIGGNDLRTLKVMTALGENNSDVNEMFINVNDLYFYFRAVRCDQTYLGEIKK